jgi:hypothetical protein
VEVCTIIAKNYLAHARVLARSLAEHNPQSRLWTLIIDDYAGYIDPAEEPFEVLGPEDIGCDAFTEMAMRYTVLELSTAVKPWLLRHLMATTAGSVTYLDPDIKVYGSLARLDETAREHGVALIPHNNIPIPPDGRRPSQVDVMIAGVYNLGYVTLAPGPEVDRLLAWWADRLRRDCRVDPIWGYFVDQRWFDLVPGFLTDFAIVREGQYNVAYWNLHSRRIEHEGGRYLVDGRPLAFFHFSGFDPAHPLVLSRHQDRIDVAEHPALERLLAEYAREVMDQGHAVSRRWPYGYLSLGDGMEIDEWVRGFCQEFLDEHEQSGQPVLSPFTFAGATTFHEWLRSDAPDAPPGINRVLARVYRQRADLQEQFPDLFGPDREGLLGWSREFGVREVPLLAKIASRQNGDEPGAVALDPELPRRLELANHTPMAMPIGVNVVASFASADESAEVARQLVRSCDEIGISALPVDEPARDENEENLRFPTVGPAQAAYGVNLICLPPERLVRFVRHAGARFFAGRYTIGVWLEAPVQDEELLARATSLLQEIWTTSPEASQALQPRLKVPVCSVAMPIDSPYVSGEAMRRRLESVRATGRVFQSLPPERRRPRGLIQAEAVLNAGPAKTARSGRGVRVRGIVRRTVLRALKPYTSYQEKANSAILEAVTELNSSLDQVVQELGEQVAVERAEFLSEVRRLNQRRVSASESGQEPAHEPGSVGPS